MTNTPQSCRIDNLRERLPRDCGVICGVRNVARRCYLTKSQETKGTNAVQRALLSRQGMTEHQWVFSGSVTVDLQIFLCEVQGSGSEDFMNFAEMVFHQMSSESENKICEHEEVEWIEQDNLFLGCLTCNGSLQVDTWQCLSCGKVGTSERKVHQAGYPCNPIEWKDASE